jgi:hypothetical protein
MKKITNYESLYQKHYKDIPNYSFWTTLIFFELSALIPAFILISSRWNDVRSIGVLILIFGSALAIGLAFLSRMISAIAISQKVVVADALLSTKENGIPTATVDDELPEL